MSEFAENLRQEFLDKEYADAYTEEFFNLYIATQIKVLREQRNLTQAQLADRSGMKQERISVLENANYESWSIKTLRKVARAFDVTLRVTFETFSHTIAEAEKLGRGSLERMPREDDLREPISPVVSEASVVEMQSSGREKSTQDAPKSAKETAYGKVRRPEVGISHSSAKVVSRRIYEVPEQRKLLQRNQQTGSVELR